MKEPDTIMASYVYVAIDILNNVKTEDKAFLTAINLATYLLLYSIGVPIEANKTEIKSDVEMKETNG